MPRIPDNYLDCVIYLYKTADDARAGQLNGGTGFFVRVPAKLVDGGHIYAVTNSHVIREAAAPVIRINTVDGKFDVIETTQDDWLDHPNGDDLSVCPVGLGSGVFAFRSIPAELFLTKELIVQHNLGPGDDVFLVGRFVNHEGRQRNLPTVRFGNVSMMPWEPVKHPRGHLQESFLVEMRSIGGYSGSPVFIWRPPFSINPGRAFTNRAYGPWLMGIDWSHLPNILEVAEKDGTPLPEKWIVKANSGMAAIVPAWKLLELLEVEELTKMREKLEKDALAEEQRAPSAVTDSADAMTKEDFEQALRKVSRRRITQHRLESTLPETSESHPRDGSI